MKSVAILIVLMGLGLFAKESSEIEVIELLGNSLNLGPPDQVSLRERHIEENQVSVTLKSFRIGKYPITASQFCDFLNAVQPGDLEEYYVIDDAATAVYNYSVIEKKDGLFIPRPHAARSPANRVTWLGAVRFCKWLSKKTNKKYRLPSEAEWEYAVRGTQERKWPWGSNDPEKNDFGVRWTRNEFDVKEPWCKVPVGSFPKTTTPEGVSDFMTYHIGEWTSNKFIEGIPSGQDMTDAACDEADLVTPRVLRGCYDKQVKLGPIDYLLYGATHEGRPWTRVGYHPLYAAQRGARYGFRVVEELPENVIAVNAAPPADIGLAKYKLLIGIVVLLMAVFFIIRKRIKG